MLKIVETLFVGFTCLLDTVPNDPQLCLHVLVVYLSAHKDFAHGIEFSNCMMQPEVIIAAENTSSGSRRLEFTQRL